MKRCPKCRETKPLADFYHGASYKSGHSPYCKECKRSRQRQARAAFKWIATDADRARFHTKYVVADSGCHLWAAKSKDRDGYGFFLLNGRQLAAHRIAWFLAGKGIPPDYPTVLDHKCRTPGCVNVAHLRVVAQGANCTTLAKGGPFKRNLEAIACLAGHPFTASDTGVANDKRSNRPMRICLVCSPSRWRFAVTAPLTTPPTARGKWGGWHGPTNTEFHILRGIVTLNRD